MIVAEKEQWERAGYNGAERWPHNAAHGFDGVRGWILNGARNDEIKQTRLGNTRSA